MKELLIIFKGSILKNKNIIIFTILIVTIIVGYQYCVGPWSSQDKLIKTIYLPTKNYNIELYINTSGGVYASNFYLIYKAYPLGFYKLIYSKDTDFLNIKFNKVNDDSVYLYEKYSVEKWYDYAETLENHRIVNHFGTKLIGYKYDTLLLDLDFFNKVYK